METCYIRDLMPIWSNNSSPINNDDTSKYQSLVMSFHRKVHQKNYNLFHRDENNEAFE